MEQFQENVEYLKNEGFSEVEAKRQSFSALVPQLTKKLAEVYLNHLQWMSQMKKDPVQKKIMETKERFVEEDSFDSDEAMEAAVEKRKFLLQNMLEDRQHFHDSDNDDTGVH